MGDETNFIDLILVKYQFEQSLSFDFANLCQLILAEVRHLEEFQNVFALAQEVDVCNLVTLGLKLK